MTAPFAIATTTFALVLIWGTLTRGNILSHSSPRQTRHWVHFGLGTSYELAWACLYAILIYVLSLANPRAGEIAGFALVAAIILYYFIDYRYFLVFQTHMPYSAREYLGEMKSLRKSIWGVVATWNFLLMVLTPVALAAWLLLFSAIRGAAQDDAGGWAFSTAVIGAYLVAGLIANTISNSYVTKNPFNPLQFTPIQFLLRTRRLAFPEPARIDGGLLQRLGARNAEYPFLRERHYEGCARPRRGWAGLCAGLRGLGQPPNLVFVILESFRAAEVGALGSNVGVSPHFDRLSRRGLLFRNFFANGFQTRDALLASYCSALPNDGPSQMRYYPHVKLLGLPELLRERGYATAWIHNADAEFDRRRQFLTRHGFDRVLDEYDFPLLSERLGWGISDVALMHLAVENMRNLQEPFFVSLLTMSNHHPYTVPREFRRRPGAGEYGRYLDAFAYSDHALGLLLELAAAHSFSQRTIFFIYADSSNRQPAPRPVRTSRDFLDLSHHLPLLIVAPWLERGETLDLPCSHIDLPPTVLDLLGHEGELPWIGRSLLSEDSQPVALLHKPAEYMALVTGQGSAIRRDRGWEWEGVPQPDLGRWAEDLLLLNRWAIENNRFLPTGSDAGPSGATGLDVRTRPSPTAGETPEAGS